MFGYVYVNIRIIGYKRKYTCSYINISMYIHKYLYISIHYVWIYIRIYVHICAYAYDIYFIYLCIYHVSYTGVADLNYEGHKRSRFIQRESIVYRSREVYMYRYACICIYMYYVRKKYDI
jgi:hypothetical protein